MQKHQSTNLIAGKNNKSLVAITFLLSTTNAESSSNLRKQDDGALLDMTQVGSRMSSLSLSMLNKKDQAETEQPSDSIMMQKEDLADSDIMAYTDEKLADADDNGDELAFGAGGAIMQALEQQDPSIAKKSKTNSKKQSKPKSAPKPKQEKKQSLVEVPKQEPQTMVQESVPQTSEVQNEIKAEQSKNQFMDNILETTITNKQTKRAQGRSMNSYEKQQAEDSAVWQQIAKKGLIDEDGEPQPQKSLAETTKPDEANNEVDPSQISQLPFSAQEAEDGSEEKVKPVVEAKKLEKKIKPVVEKKKIEIKQKKKIQIKPVAKKISAEAIKPKEKPALAPIQGASEIESQTSSLITPAKILGNINQSQDLSQKSTEKLLSEASNALTPEQIQQATDEANAIKAQEQVQKMKDAPPEVIKEDKSAPILPSLADVDMPKPPSFNVAEEAAPAKEMTDAEFKAKAEQAEQRHLDKVKKMIYSTQAAGGSVSVSTIISQLGNVKQAPVTNEYADSQDLQHKEDIHLEKKAKKTKKIQIKPKPVQKIKTANHTSNTTIKSKLKEANRTTLVLKAKNVTSSKNITANHTTSANTTSNKSLNATHNSKVNVTANKTQNVTMNLVQKNESQNATKQMNTSVKANSTSKISSNKTEPVVHKKRAATQTMKLSLVHLDIKKNGTTNKTVRAKSAANDTEALNKTSMPNCSLEKTRAHDQLERQVAKKEAIKQNQTGSSKYKDLNTNVTKTAVVQKNETVKANVTTNQTVKATVNATSNVSANTTITLAKNTTQEIKHEKNQTKTAVVIAKKPKVLTVDEQIDQVYDEIHAGEGEKSPEGFIGKYQKKIQDKKRAQEAAKNAYDEETTRSAYMAAGQVEPMTLSQRIKYKKANHPKKRGIMARIEEKAEAEEMESMDNDQIVAAAMSDPMYQAKIMELTQKKAVLQNARVEAMTKSEPTQAEKTQALAEALLTDGS